MTTKPRLRLLRFREHGEDCRTPTALRGRLAPYTDSLMGSPASSRQSVDDDDQEEEATPTAGRHPLRTRGTNSDSTTRRVTTSSPLRGVRERLRHAYPTLWSDSLPKSLRSPSAEDESGVGPIDPHQRTFRSIHNVLDPLTSGETRANDLVPGRSADATSGGPRAAAQRLGVIGGRGRVDQGSSHSCGANVPALNSRTGTCDCQNGKSCAGSDDRGENMLLLVVSGRMRLSAILINTCG
jgi:hypothetical protein